MIETSTTCRALAPRTPRLEAPSTAKVTTLLAHQSRSGIQDSRTHSSCVATSCASPQATSTTPRNTSHMPPRPVPGKKSTMAYSLMRCLCLSGPSSNSAMNGAKNKVCVTSACMASCIAAIAFSTIHRRDAWCPGADVREQCRRMRSLIARMEVHLLNPIYTSTNRDRMAASASDTATPMSMASPVRKSTFPLTTSAVAPAVGTMRDIALHNAA